MAAAHARGMKSSSTLAVTAVTVTMLLGGCGGSGDQPAVCDSLDAVQASVDHMNVANYSENGMSQMRSDLEGLKLNLQQLTDDAQAQVQPQVQAIRASADQVSASVSAAKANPTETTLDGVRGAMAALSDALRGARTAVSGTC